MDELRNKPKRMHSSEQPVIVLHAKQASRLFALLLFVACLIFVGGYFWGQRTAVDQLLHSIENDAFADQIYYSMCSAYDQRDDGSSGSDAERDQNVSIQKQARGETRPLDTKVKNNVEPVPSAPVSFEKFYAQLAGFGTRNAAEKMKRRLDAKGIKTIISKRTSRSVKGKAVSWFQVITPDYKSKNDLMVAVDTIKKYERLHDIRVRKRG